MRNSIVVNDTTTIIYMSAIGAMRLVKFLFTKISIPHAVYHQLTSIGNALSKNTEEKSYPWGSQKTLKIYQELSRCRVANRLFGNFYK